MVSFVCRAKGANLMTNKKFKKAAMALALTACVAATPLAANAETPENAADAQAPAAVDHTEADTQEAPEAELPAEEEPEAQPAAQPAAPEATPIAVELPTAEETPEEKEETPVEVTPTEDAVVEKETPAEEPPVVLASAPAAAKANADIPMETPDADIAAEGPDADIATMDGMEKEVSEDEAKIGDTSYGTLQGAIDNAKAGDEVVLQKDHTGNITIAEWIKLNLNKHKIEGNVDVDLSGKKDDATTSQDGEAAVEKKVEIVDGTITGGTDSGVKIIGADVELKDVTITGNKGTYGGGVSIDKKSNVTFTDCTITGNEAARNGGGIYAKGGSTVTVNGGSISGNSAAGTTWGTSGGGGIYAEGGSTVNLNDTTIADNHVTGNYGSGGGVRVNNGTLSADHVKILENTTNSNGGGISVKDSVLTVTDSEIRNNVAGGSNGGGVEIIGSTTDNKEHTITNTEITDNSAEERGGGVYVEQASITIKDSTLDNNHAKHTDGSQASSEGGGLSVRGGKDVTLDNTKVTNNSAKDGGGIWVRDDVDTNVTIKNNCKITGNKSVYAGGGVMVRQDFNKKIGISIENSTIENNSAANGGGIYLGAQKLTITDSKLTGNNTISNNGQTQGGAIVAYSPGDFTLDNTLIQGNTADVGGGIHVLSTKLRDSHIILCNNTRITGNVANLFGGGIFLDNMNNPAVLELVNASVDNNTANVAGGIGNYGSIVVLKDGAVLENNTAKQYGGGLYNRGKVTVESGATVMNNTASTYGGGLYNKGEATVESGAKLYNNHAALAGDDIYLAGKNSTLTLTKVGDDWMLDDCGHKINGWFADLLDARWDADGKQEHVINLKDYAADGLTIVENEDGSYTITILDENATLALKAAHNVTPKPTPDPDPEPTPDPDTPDTPVSPEDPTTPPVQDATPEDAETPVNPENPTNPPVQDATPDSTVATLPKTGVNWLTALAMALSGMALTVAGAFTSLFAKSKH